MLAALTVAGGCGLSPARPTARNGTRPSTTTTATPTAAVTIPPATTTTVVEPPVTPWRGRRAAHLQCGTVAVPLDYDDPQEGTINIVVAMHRATDPAARIGSLVIDPGGPGESGVNDLPAELSVLTPGSLARFDIV